MKVVTLDTLLEWRCSYAHGLVFTNGVFDLLHHGHVACLEAARNLGEALVVGVNTDRSARMLDKGPGRPVMPEAVRCRVLAALQAVDRVVTFDEPTPRELISVLRPDILVKGGDYRAEDVVGADLVASYGGRVHITEFVSDAGASSILERLHGTS